MNTQGHTRHAKGTKTEKDKKAESGQRHKDKRTEKDRKT